MLGETTIHSGGKMAATRWHRPIFLKTDTKMEPLACRWYAWPHLLSPTLHALNLAFRQIPALKSFLSNPAVHAAAERDPELFTGQFVPLPAACIVEVRKLLEDMEKSCSSLVQFALDWRAAARSLQDCATDASLDDFYSGLPASLAGLVELAHDVNGHPSMRVLEEMLATTDLGNAHTQELSLFSGRDPERAFFLNTPRLRTPCRLDLAVPFEDPRIDLLSSMRIRAAPFGDVVDAFGLDEPAARRFESLVTSEAPARREPDYSGDGVRLRYFGHACVLVQSAATSVLFDPVVAWDREPGGATLTFDDLPDRIDTVFLTHNHQDHFCPETLLQLRARVGRVLTPTHNRASIADPSMPQALRQLGIRHATALTPLSHVDIPGGRITSLPFFGEHAGLDMHSKHGALVELKGRRFLFLADSDCAEPRLYERLRDVMGNVDALFIGMECDGAPLSWLYAPYLTRPVTRAADESRRLSGANCERAWKVIDLLGCRRVFVYAMGQEPWLRHLLGLAYTPDSIQIVESNRLVERCRAHGIPAERLTGCGEIRF